MNELHRRVPARTNWAGNYTYSAPTLVVPATVEEVRAAVAAAGKVHALGSRHCFNDIADTPGTHVSLERLRSIVSVDAAKARVTVDGGVRYGDVGIYLDERGFALHNAASLPHITIAGATATGTHGSGSTLGNLATAVAGIEFINAAGELVTLSRDTNPDVFAGAVVHLGGLGVVTRLTLDLKPAFSVRQDIFRGLPVAALEAHFAEIMASGYSVSIFTTWREDAAEQLWVKSVVPPGTSGAPPASSWGAGPAATTTHPVDGLDTVNCTEQMGVPGPAHDRLHHFKVGSVPAGGDDLQVEFFVAIEDAPAVVRTLRRHAASFTPHLLVGEIRTVAADDLWMSPCYRRSSAAFHFSFKWDLPAVLRLLPGLEEVLAPFAPRPHWGKLFAMAPSVLRSRYAKLPAFRDLLREHDPHGKFRNAWLDRHIFSA